jgi:hypothetical protein
MKFTPFILFLILIFVLIISIVFSRFFPLWKGSSNQEGMIDYGNTLEPLQYTESTSIPQYSDSQQLLKVYDSIFYDTNNSNVIVVDGKLRGCVAGNLIETITVIPPDGLTNYKIYNTSNRDSPESKYTFSNKNTSWKYITNDDQKINNDKYYMFYIAKNRERFMHIIKTPNISTTPIVINNVCSFYHNKNGEVKERVDYTQNEKKATINISTSDVSATSNDRTFIKLPEYDKNNNVYQLKSNVFFDVRNGNLIVKDTKIKVYNRSQQYITGKDISTTIPTATSFSSWMVNDTIDKEEKSRGNIILYMANGQNTVIVILSLINQTISIDNNIYKFNSGGIDTGISSSGSGGSSGTDGSTDVNSDINKWLAYWTVVAGGDKYSDDYLLKTQVVPPVCPSCPSCPNNGTCTNCGGQGGSGTLSGSGTSVAGTGAGSRTGPNNLTVSAGGSSAYATTANPDTLGGATTIQTMEVTKGLENIAGTGANVIEKTVDTAGNIVEKTGSGAVGLLKDTGSGASNLITSGASGAAGLLRDTVSGAVGLAKDTVSGAIGLAKEAGSGVTNVLSGGGRSGQSAGYSSGQSAGYGSRQSAGYGSGQSQGLIDPYSYSGALVSKPSNFIPVTTDFSAFGK